MLASLLHERLKKVQRTCFWASYSSSFWCIYCSARLSCPEHSYGSLLSCYGLYFAAPVRGEGSDSKLPSALLALLLARWLSEISRRGLYPLQKKLWGGSCNWIQTGCDRCWHYWCCCRQIPPLAIVLPNRFAPNWQMLSGTLLSCYSVSWSSCLFEGGR